MGARRQRGHTLVQVLVGLAVGLIVSATAIALTLGQLREHRAAWIRSRLVQELRDAADAVERDLRRAGHWSRAPTAAWSDAPPALNPHAALAPIGGGADTARWSYSRDEADEQIGLRLRDGVIEMLLGGGGWQALTDAGTVVVTALRLTPAQQTFALQSLCARAGPTSAPTLSARSMTVAIEGRAVADPRIVRSVQTLVQLRNDLVTGACPS